MCHISNLLLLSLYHFKNVLSILSIFGTKKQSSILSHLQIVACVHWTAVSFTWISIRSDSISRHLLLLYKDWLGFGQKTTFYSVAKVDCPCVPVTEDHTCFWPWACIYNTVWAVSSFCVWLIQSDTAVLVQYISDISGWQPSVIIRWMSSQRPLLHVLDCWTVCFLVVRTSVNGLNKCLVSMFWDLWRPKQPN